MITILLAVIALILVMIAIILIRLLYTTDWIVDKIVDLCTGCKEANE